MYNYNKGVLIYAGLFPGITVTPTPTITYTPTPTLTYSPTPTVTYSPTPTVTYSPTPTVTITPTVTYSPTTTVTLSPSDYDSTLPSGGGGIDIGVRASATVSYDQTSYNLVTGVSSTASIPISVSAWGHGALSSSHVYIAQAVLRSTNNVISTIYLYPHSDTVPVTQDTTWIGYMGTYDTLYLDVKAWSVSTSTGLSSIISSGSKTFYIGVNDPRYTTTYNSTPSVPGMSVIFTTRGSSVSSNMNPWYLLDKGFLGYANYIIGVFNTGTSNLVLDLSNCVTYNKGSINRIYGAGTINFRDSSNNAITSLTNVTVTSGDYIQIYGNSPSDTELYGGSTAVFDMQLGTNLSIGSYNFIVEWSYYTPES